MIDLIVSEAGNSFVENSSSVWSTERHNESDDTIRDLLSNEMGFVFNRDFETLAYEDVEAAGDAADNFIQPDVDSPALSGLPPYIAALYSLPLLTASGEAALFRKMNFLKYWVNVFRSTIDPKRPCFETIEEIRILLAEAERTRNQIIECNLRLVVSIARKFAGDRVSFEDLVSEGNTILMKAVEKFDYSRGFRFSTYVTHSVQRHYYRHFSRAQRRSEKELLVSEQFLKDEAGPAPVDESADFDPTQADILLSRMDGILDEREQFIVRERFGFGPAGKVRTFQSLAEDLGICKERVRQLLNFSLDKLRDMARNMKMETAAS